MDYIRKYYGVPAKRGGRIKFTGWSGERAKHGTIIGSKDARLRVRFDDEPKRIALLHPTWEVEYL